jgi:hypothetical protein
VLARGLHRRRGENLSEAALEAATKRFQDMGAELQAGGKDRGWLFVGEADLTAEWERCERETGYARPEYVTDQNEELRDKQAAAAAGATWAQCAREHGFPGTKDPAPPVSDDWETEPAAVLPATITPDELRALLVECPSFDREARLKADRRLAEDPELGEDEYWAIRGKDPVIGYDVPCLDGSAAVCDDATWSKYNPLSLVIEEQTNAYLEELNAGG